MTRNIPRQVVVQSVVVQHKRSPGNEGSLQGMRVAKKCTNDGKALGNYGE
jgi:hypothetical protein